MWRGNLYGRCPRSLGGRVGLPLHFGYSSSKAALTGFSQSLRSEVEQLGIRVVVVEAGDVNAGITALSNDTAHGEDPVYATRLHAGRPALTAGG